MPDGTAGQHQAVRPGVVLRACSRIVAAVSPHKRHIAIHVCTQHWAHWQSASTAHPNYECTQDRQEETTEYHIMLITLFISEKDVRVCRTCISQILGFSPVGENIVSCQCGERQTCVHCRKRTYQDHKLSIELASSIYSKQNIAILRPGRPTRLSASPAAMVNKLQCIMLSSTTTMMLN